MLNNIFNFFSYFDLSLKKSNQIIEKEIEKGGRFERLQFPIKELNYFNVIQFFRMDDQLGEIAGLGADANIKTAYIKAIVEYFERLAFFKNAHKFSMDSTNGIASHRLEFIAKKNAENELFERDSFLRHWYSNTGFENLSLVENEKSLELILRNNKIEILLLKTFLGFKTTFVCVLKNTDTNGFAIGLSCGRKNDREKAIHEALINLYFGNIGKSKIELIEEINKNGIMSLESHRAYWLYMEELPSWIVYKGEKPDLKRLTKESRFKIIEKHPFVTIQCLNEELIPFSFGSMTNIYMDALTKIGINVVYGKTMYHPIP